MTTVQVGGVALELHPSGVALERVSGRLLVADLHLGKGATLRAAGLPIPEGTSSETMARLDAVVRDVGRTRVREVWVLGDLVHARAGLSRDLVRRVAAWTRSLPGKRLHLVRGNHDRGAGVLPDSWAAERHEEPCVASEGSGQLTLTHEPEITREPHVCGHLHPMVRAGRGRTRVPKLPAFVGRAAPEGSLALLVLPAFGSFVDGAVIRGQPGWHAWACADEELVALPPGAW